MARCDECKYWSPPPPYNQNPLGLNDCTKAVVLWDASDWNYDNEPGNMRVMKPEFKDQMMFAQDGSDYKARLITRADFFCAHWLRKV